MEAFFNSFKLSFPWEPCLNQYADDLLVLVAECEEKLQNVESKKKEW